MFNSRTQRGYLSYPHSIDIAAGKTPTVGVLPENNLAGTPMRAPLTSTRLALLMGMAVLALGTRSARPQTALVAPHGVAQEQFICHFPGTAERRVGIFRLGDGQRCRVDYTRDGRTRSLWNSGHDYQFCVRKALDIIGLLQSVNFKCTPEANDGSGSTHRSGPEAGRGSR